MEEGGRVEESTYNAFDKEAQSPKKLSELVS